MLRKHAHVFVALLWLFDMVVLAASFAVSCGLRLLLKYSYIGRPPGAFITHSTHLFAAAVVTWSLCFYSMGLYGVSRRTDTRARELSALARAIGCAALLLVTTQYFIEEQRYSRAVLIIFTVISFVALGVTRVIARRFLGMARRRGKNVRYALVVGANHIGKALIERLDEHAEFGIRIIGVLASDEAQVGKSFAGHLVTGVYSDLVPSMKARRPDQVYLAMTSKEHVELERAHASLATESVDVCVVPDVITLVSLRRGVEDIGGLPIIHLRTGPLVGIDAWTKRAFDLVVASAVLLAVSPVMMMCALLVKLSSRGPIFYRQERMGLDGHVFEMLKFRSMPVNAEAGTGAVWAKSGENRAFPFGAFMRKYSLDELPQFFNVIKGDMSLVGPRPERPVFIEQFKHQIPGYNLRHKVKAGITGLAQVEGWRGDTDLEKRIERDLHYIENWSLWLDCKIFIRTGLGGFLSKNAY